MLAQHARWVQNALPEDQKEKYEDKEVEVDILHTYEGEGLAKLVEEHQVNESNVYYLEYVKPKVQKPGEKEVDKYIRYDKITANDFKNPLYDAEYESSMNDMENFWTK